jgi:hypothetical protein
MELLEGEGLNLLGTIMAGKSVQWRRYELIVVHVATGARKRHVRGFHLLCIYRSDYMAALLASMQTSVRE